MRILFSILVAVAANSVHAASLGHNRQCTDAEISRLLALLSCNAVVTGEQFSTAALVTLKHPSVECEGAESYYLRARHIFPYWIKNGPSLFRVDVSKGEEGAASFVESITSFNDRAR